MSKSAEKKKKKKKASPVFIILLIVAIAIFVFAGYNLLKIALRYKEAQDSYKELETLFLPEDDEEEETSRVNSEDSLPFKWDYDSLLALNPDAVGWIYAKDLLNYPIVRGDDNEKYLHILFDGTYNPSGTLFVDARHPQRLKGPYAIVYGHNMRDGSMFGQLYKYADKSFYDEHPKMHVMIGYKHYIYNVVGAYTASVDGFTYSDALSEEDIPSYIEKVRSNSPYLMYDGKITKNTNVMVLSTCTADSAELYRYVVILTRDHEVFD